MAGIEVKVENEIGKGMFCDLSKLRTHLQASGLDKEDAEAVLHATIEAASAISGYVTEMESEYRPCVKAEPGHRHQEFYEAAIYGIGLWFQILELQGILSKQSIEKALKNSRLVCLEKKVITRKDGASA